MTIPGYCAWGCFQLFVWSRCPLPQGEGGYVPLSPYSQDQVEKSFSYCGTSFQTPFSFLAVMVMSCGWYM